MALMMIGCGNADAERGIKATDASTALLDFLELYTSDGDYLNACSSSIDEGQVEKSLKACADDGGIAFVTEDGAEMYEKLKGKSPKVASNQELLGVYGGEGADIWDLSGGQGYALIEKNANSGNYVIVDFCFE
jgi:hypothetical protein